VDAIVGLAGLLVHECMFFRTREAIVPGLVRAVGRARKERSAVAPPPVRHSVGRLDRTHHGSCYRQR
jgi:hypothetical protein